MYEGSRYMLYALLAIPGLIAGFYVLAIVVALGPAGWFFLAFLGLAAMATKVWIGEDEVGADAVERINCRECGAPNPVDEATCGYCDASLPKR